jgi:ankyrin repeat protein
LDILKSLVAFGADVHARDANGFSAREWAISRGQKECADFLFACEESLALEGAAAGSASKNVAPRL